MGKHRGAVFLPLKIRKRLNAPPANQPWGWFSFELLESAAMRSLSVNGRRVLDRIRLEHMAHAGLENGRLKVTWDDFVKFGVGRRFISGALTEVIAAGIVAITQPGRKAWGRDPGDPTQYRLTFPSQNQETSGPPQTNGRASARQRPPRPVSPPATAKIKPSFKRGLDSHKNFCPRSPMVN
jgi:hypothetical protein